MDDSADVNCICTGRDQTTWLSSDYMDEDSPRQPQALKSPKLTLTVCTSQRGL